MLSEESKQKIVEGIYQTITGQAFHKFYNSESKDSLTNHIQDSVEYGAPTKNEIKAKIERVFGPVWWELERT